jgi:PleD family two-component response regulator
MGGTGPPAALTGGHNRRHLDQRLRAELAFAVRHYSPLSVLLLDIGEESAVIARGIPAPGAWLLAERIRETVATLCVPHEGETISFTISMGVVTMDAERSFPNVEALLGAADQALYKAKTDGRNRRVKG